MKNRGWLALLTAGLVLILAFCFYARQKLMPEENPVPALSFRVYSDETSGASEEILCWNQDDERCFVFLPSYADLRRTEVQLHASQHCQLGGVRLTHGLNCGTFSLNTEYELTGEGFSPKTLQFVQSANVATIYIDTFSGSMERIHADKNYRERVTTTVYTVGGNVDYKGYDFIKARGNSSWYLDKKPYNLYLNHSSSLLEMDEATEWTLNANAFDGTNLRNKLVYDFANSISPHSGWAPESDYVDLYLNGEYAGLYLLCEKKENIANKFKENRDECITICLNDHITKLDNPDNAFKLNDCVFAEIVEPSVSSTSESARLEAYLHELMDALPTDNWIDDIDLDSFARKYLVEEIFTNTDGGQASQYYYWDKSVNKLYAGPCWDYDLTLGDTTWVDWISPYCLLMQDALWYKDLWTHKDFVDYVHNLYCSECLPLLNQLLEDLPSIAKNIENAANANHIRWSTLYDNSHDLMSMRQFLANRIDFLNSLWVQHAEYCKVSFATRGPRGYPIVSLYVPVHSSGHSIPTPKDVGIDGESVWYREDNDQPFEYDSTITEDLTLYTPREQVKADSIRPDSDYSIEQLIVLISTIIPLLLLIPSLLFIDYRRNKSGKRHGHA